MALSDIIAATKLILDTVTGIGKTHAYARWSADEATDKSLYISSGKLNAWMITREATPEAIDYAGSSLDNHTIVIHGYYSLDDSANTEATFQNLIEAVRDKFQRYRRLTIDGVAKSDGISRIKVRQVDHRMFAGKLTHHAELVFDAQDFVGDPGADDLDTTP